MSDSPDANSYIDNLIKAKQPDHGTRYYPNSPNAKVRFIELNGTMVDLNEVTLIRKSNQGTNNFVIVMKDGYEDQPTAKYDSRADFEQDWKIIRDTLYSMNSF